MRLLRPLEGLLGVLQRLFRKLVPGQMIFLPVVRGGSAVRVRGEFVKFSSSLMRIIWHVRLPLSFISQTFENRHIFPSGTPSHRPRLAEFAAQCKPFRVDDPICEPGAVIRSWPNIGDLAALEAYHRSEKGRRRRP